MDLMKVFSLHICVNIWYDNVNKRWNDIIYIETKDAEAAAAEDILTWLQTERQEL